MGLLNGAVGAATGLARIATAPVRTLGKIAGTGLSTAGNVVGKLAEGDLSGAAGAAVEGGQKQLGNVTGYFGEQLQGVKQVVGGHAEFLGGGLSLIGTPIKGAARLAGNSLNTSGTALGQLVEGDLSGAATTYGKGVGNAVSIVSETASNQLDNVV